MKNTAVIYARFSSSRQREESIEGQVRECKAYAERQGLRIIKIYADRAISGRTDRRPEFQQMIEDSKAKQFARVIVYTFDRFARDSYASAVYKHQLKRNGVRVISAKENVDDSPAGVLMERVFEGFAEYYSLELAQKVKRGMRENALKGIWSSGAPPFGYQKDESGRLVKNPEQVEILQRVFKYAADGRAFIDICRYLNDLGFRPPNSTKLGYRQDNLYRLLKNPIAIGKFVWADVVLEDYGHCRIISDELFEAVQLRLNSKKRRGNVNMIEYALSGKIFCGKCEAPMFGVCGTSGTNKQKYYYYKCANTVKGKHDCDMPAINRNLLEKALHEKIVALLHDPKTLATIAQEALSIINSGEDIELLTMRKRLLQLKPEADKTVDMYLDCDDSRMRDAITKKYRALTEEIETLETEIAKRSINIEDRHITEDMIISFLKKMSQESKRKLLQTMVQKVVINKNNGDDSYTVTAALNYTPTATTSNKIDIEFNKVARNSSHRYELVGPVGFEPTTSRL